MSTNRCPKCGHTVDLKEGKYGLFYGCSYFPKCRFTESYYVCEGAEWNIDRYEEYLINKELDAVVMENERNRWRMSNDRFKSRVWDEEYHRYHKDTERYRETGEFYPDIEGCYCFGDFLKQPTRFIAEQCIGLPDKNGNLIYEGDVLGFYIDVHPVYVQWDSDRCRFVLRRFDIEGWEISLTRDTASRYTIIGNIHELEVKK